MTCPIGFKKHVGLIDAITIGLYSVVGIYPVYSLIIMYIVRGALFLPKVNGVKAVN